MATEEGWMRAEGRPKDAPLIQGTISVNEQGFSFACSSSEFNVTWPAEDLLKPMASTSKYLLKVRGRPPKKDVIFDFTQAEGDAERRMNSVKNAILTHMPKTATTTGGGGQATQGNDKLAMEKTSAAIAKLGKDNFVFALRQELVLSGIMSEEEFWQRTEKLDSSRRAPPRIDPPVPSAIPTMTDMVRTNTEVKVTLDEGQIHKLYLDFPSLKAREEEFVGSGKLSRTAFFTGFYDYLENGKTGLVDSKNQQIFEPVFEHANNLSNQNEQKKMKRALCQAHRSVNLTAILPLCDFYGGPRGAGLASGPVTKRQKLLWEARSGRSVADKNSDPSRVVERVNRHQASVVETLKSDMEATRDGAEEPQVSAGSSTHASWQESLGGAFRESDMYTREGATGRELKVDKMQILAKGSRTKENGASRERRGNGELSSSSPVEEWKIKSRRSVAPSPAGFSDLNALPAGKSGRGSRAEPIGEDVRKKESVIKGLLRHLWATIGFGSKASASSLDMLSKLQSKLEAHEAELVKMVKRDLPGDLKALEHAQELIRAAKAVNA